jgi:DNA-binding SARP family transcriptional activator
VTLLGLPQASLNGQLLTFARRASLALLAYLAINRRRHRREALATLLADETARGTVVLSNALSDLRKQLGNLLLIDRETVALAPELLLRLDTDELERSLADAENDSAALEACLDQCQHDFLAGFSLAGAPEFEHWQLSQRQYFHHLLLRACTLLYRHYRRAQAFETMLRYARRLLSFEPWNESAHRMVMLALMHNGQRAAALAQFEACCRILADEFGARPGPHTSAIADRIRDGLPPPHNLPPEPGIFVGRHVERAQLTAWLDDPERRLIAISGSGGSGKTRLSCHVARNYIADPPGPHWQRFPDGVFFVALDNLDMQPHNSAEASKAQIFAAIARTLGLPQHHAERAVLGLLCERTLLLILDNTEHLSGIERVVERILAHAPEVTMLLTSRRTHTCTASETLTLGPLMLPHSSADLEQAEASQLFLALAEQVGRSIVIDGEDRVAIMQICRASAGLPLAIVHAAQHLRRASCKDIAARLLADPLDLATPLRNLPPRHRCLRANAMG